MLLIRMLEEKDAGTLLTIEIGEFSLIENGKTIMKHLLSLLRHLNKNKGAS